MWERLTNRQKTAKENILVDYVITCLKQSWFIVLQEQFYLFLVKHSWVWLKDLMRAPLMLFTHISITSHSRQIPHCLKLTGSMCFAFKNELWAKMTGVICRQEAGTFKNQWFAKFPPLTERATTNIPDVGGSISPPLCPRQPGAEDLWRTDCMSQKWAFIVWSHWDLGFICYYSTI